ncbi:MAG: sensor histidine kinase [Candidatus Pristimantibacillus sp.]
MTVNKSLNQKLTLFFALLTAVCFAFTGYGIWMVRIPIVSWILVLFSVFILLMFMVLVWVIRNHMTDLLAQLSQMIATLIDRREDEVFSVLDDNMLSKLQSQVIKLAGILRMQNTKFQTERDEIKSLISDISHQLKTPLANLQMYSTFIQDKDLDVQQRQAFSENIQSQVEKLSWLMESLIKMSRLESGIMQVKPEQGDVNDTILTAIKQVFELAQQHSIEISFLASEQELRLPHDPRWTAEALFNLLDNAVKYTEGPGQITIQTHRYELFARIDIEDTGVGIAEAEIPRIFGRFYRSHPNRQDHEGVGIGLYLARKIIMMQGGYIKVSSTLGKGSVFSVFLPLNA